MATIVDLEFVLSWRADEERFQLSLAFDDPDDMTDRRLIWPDSIAIDAVELRGHEHDTSAYGEELTKQLFPAEELRDFYRRAKSKAAEHGIPIRVRLSIDPDAPPEFQAIRWETICDLDTGTPIALRTDVRLTRYLSGAGWDRIAPPRKHDLRALVVIANPSNLDDVDVVAPLAPVDVEAEAARAREALGGIAVTMLPSESDGRATLSNIVNVLDTGIDVLYLVCHGNFVNGQSLLYLEDDAGNVAPATASEVRAKIEARQHKPALAVLCSCFSAGSDVTADGGAMAPLGPQLAQAGIAAIVAMQSNITMTTAQAFLGTFLSELDKDGIVDRAVAAARTTVSERHDWWVPVLFTRLKRGRTYYSVGFSVTDLRLQMFVRAVKEGRCTPVLGPGLAEPILGSRAEVARDWVDRWLLPISDPANTSLTTVGQYVQTVTPDYMAHDELAKFVVTRLTQDERYGDIDSQLFGRKDSTDLLKELGRRARENDPEEPHAAMAGLDLPIYITTSWTGLLTEALEAANKEPQVRHFAWNHALGPEPAVEDPTPERPLVYHLFGRLSAPESLVLTEDDHFQWLATWAEKRQEALPKDVYEALIGRSLMFVGYRLHEWDFRVLFQGLRNLRGNDLFKKRSHVGVQVDPSAPGVESEASQDYLNKYFERGGLTIFWGTTKEFLRELTNLMGEQ